MEHSLSLHLHQKAGQMPTQVADSTRPVPAHRIRVRIQGHRHQQTNKPAQGRCLPRRPRFAGEYLRRTQDALPDGLRPGQDPGRQPTVYVRRHCCSQPHPRVADPTQSSRPWHHRKARRAVVFPGDWDPSPYSHPTRRAHDSPRRQIGPLHEQQRKTRKRAPPCSAIPSISRSPPISEPSTSTTNGGSAGGSTGASSVVRPVRSRRMALRQMLRKKWPPQRPSRQRTIHAAIIHNGQ